MVPNPNAPVESEPALPTERETVIAERLAVLIAGWPGVDDAGVAITTISARELAVQLRRDLPAGVPAAVVTPGRMRGWLRGLGHRLT